MKKKRKRVLNANCSAIWSKLVRYRDGNKCLICGKTEHLNAHHLILRKILEYAFLPINGITLCSYCHTWSPYNSPHSAPWAFEEWMKLNCPEQYKWWVEHRGVINPSQIDYEQTLETLKRQLCLIEGIPFKTNGLQMFSDEIEQQICKDYEGGLSLLELQKKYGAKNESINCLLKRHKIKMRGNNRSVAKLSLDGTLLQIYPSITIAAEQNRLNKTSLNFRLNKDKRDKKDCIFGGFKWTYHTGGE